MADRLDRQRLVRVAAEPLRDRGYVSDCTCSECLAIVGIAVDALLTALADDADTDAASYYHDGYDEPYADRLRSLTTDGQQ